jgi:hypothetical protein
MDQVLLVFAVVFVAAVVGLGIYLGRKAAQKRRQDLAALAAELGWTFDPAKDKSHDDRYTQFEVFRQGHSRAAYNTLTGPLAIDGRDFPAIMGDFTYAVTRSNGKTTTTTVYNLSYLILHLPFRAVPDLYIRPESFLDKFAAAIGFDDIDFESAEFSRKFHVKSSDKRFAYDVVHPRMMEFLMQSPGRTIDIQRGCICLTSGTKRWEPAAFRANLDWTRSFFDLWPDHLTAQLEPKPATRPS